MTTVMVSSIKGGRVGSSAFAGRAVCAQPAAVAVPRARAPASISAALKLVPCKQTTAQKVACGTVRPGFMYEMWEPAEASFSKDTLYFGRDNRPGTEVDVVICVPSVDSVHAKITIAEDGKSLTVEDLGSENGTFINGTPVKGATEVKAGDEVSFDIQRGITFKVAKDSIIAKVASAISGPPAASSSEAALDARIGDRQSWISAWKERTGKTDVIGGAVAASSSEAALESRLGDRQAWISSWKARTGKGSAAASSSEAALDARLGDRQAWISSWKARTGKGSAASSSEAALDARLGDRQAWISSWKARTGKDSSASSSEAALDARLGDRQSWIASWKARTGKKETVKA